MSSLSSKRLYICSAVGFSFNTISLYSFEYTGINPSPFIRLSVSLFISVTPYGFIDFVEVTNALQFGQSAYSIQPFSRYSVLFISKTHLHLKQQNFTGCSFEY